MHLDQSALGILRKAEDKNGRKYMDWRIPYMDQPGLIMVYKSDSRYEKYQVYFFTSPASDCPGKYLHTTYGSIQVEDGSLTIRTKNSVYEFELDASCVSEVDMILLLHTVNEYFRDDGMGGRQCCGSDSAAVFTVPDSIGMNGRGRNGKHMSSVENVEIFEDTKWLCETNGKIKDTLARSVKNQKLIPERMELSAVDKARFTDEAKIIVCTKRTVEAAAGYAGQEVVVHNFASATKPGGGVTRGSSAQEECLCRCSGLYFCLSVPEMMKSFYYLHRNVKNPINNADIIYTPDVTVFKTDTGRPKLMNEAEWYDVDVITCAAPNLRERPSNRFNQGNGDRAVKVSDRELLEIHKKRLTRILDVAVLNGDEVVILGAFGCGAFQNKPEVVARAAHEVIADYLHELKTIEFAVYCP